MKILRNKKAVFQFLFLILLLSVFSVHMAAAAQPSALAAGPAADQAPHDNSTSHQNGDSHQGSGHANIGEFLPLWSCIPFAGILLSIALFPLILPDFWHHHFGKISAFWSASLAIPFLIAFKGAALYEILHIILADYVPFIILLWSLYTVSGGILLRGTLRGTPIVNVTILIIGALLASWMGTTGAAMLLIRPFLRANNYLGDPPLFLGFLHGVSFFWTFKIMPHMLAVVGILLVIYFILDTYHYRKEGVSAPEEEGVKEPLKLEGIHNFLFLGGIVGAVLMSGIVDWGEINTLGIHRSIQDWVRDGLLILMGILSLVTTRIQIRDDNDFTWFPITYLSP
jgi:Na+/H+ antiporter NhaD/arsenite permease-like protein